MKIAKFAVVASSIFIASVQASSAQSIEDCEAITRGGTMSVFDEQSFERDFRVVRNWVEQYSSEFVEEGLSGSFSEGVPSLGGSRFGASQSERSEIVSDLNTGSYRNSEWFKNLKRSSRFGDETVANTWLECVRLMTQSSIDGYYAFPDMGTLQWLAEEKRWRAIVRVGHRGRGETVVDSVFMSPFNDVDCLNSPDPGTTFSANGTRNTVVGCIADPAASTFISLNGDTIEIRFPQAPPTPSPITISPPAPNSYIISSRTEGLVRPHYGPDQSANWDRTAGQGFTLPGYRCDDAGNWINHCGTCKIERLNGTWVLSAIAESADRNFNITGEIAKNSVRLSGRRSGQVQVRTLGAQHSPKTLTCSFRAQ